jgi:hypothetical protein
MGTIVRICWDRPRKTTVKQAVTFLGQAWSAAMSLRNFHGDFCAYFLLWVDWFCYNYFENSQVIAFG